MDSDSENAKGRVENGIDCANLAANDDQPNWDFVPDNMSDWSMVSDIHIQPEASLHNCALHCSQLHSSQRVPSSDPNRSVGTPRLQRSLKAPVRSMSSLPRPDPPASRPASVQVRSMSSGKPRPKSGLRRLLSLQPQIVDEVIAFEDGTSHASIVSPQISRSKKPKLPIKAPSSGMVVAQWCWNCGPNS